MEGVSIILIAIMPIVMIDTQNTTMEMENITTNDNETIGEMEVPICLKVRTHEALQTAIEAGLVHYTRINNSEIWAEEFLSCTKVSLGSNDLCALNHSSIFVPAYKLSYSSENYYIEGEEVYICLHFQHKEGDSESVSLGAHLTKVGISISNVCLALHLLVFILISEMRNLPGSNLAALAVAVFFSNLFFLVSKEAKERKACITVSAFTLYFFLSSFLWMSVIGFETWRSLRTASTELRLSTKFMERKMYRYYSLYAWLTPLILVSIVLILDASDGIEDKFKPGLSTEMRCWFTQLAPLIIFFLVPLIIVMASNLLFFLWSAIIIHKHTDRLNQDKKFKSLIQKFSSYSKLAIITGLTWITGIVAFAVNRTATWYIFIVFTTFYGLFIFVAFTCTKKVYKLIRKHFPVVSKWMPSHSTDTSTSKSVTSESKI